MVFLDSVSGSAVGPAATGSERILSSGALLSAACADGQRRRSRLGGLFQLAVDQAETHGRCACCSFHRRSAAERIGPAGKAEEGGLEQASPRDARLYAPQNATPR
ncbi:hypothetical protein ACGRHY_26405 [Streptomyces sp. HK10]|uniref:hypothetical protein n=1 Tax=Streptomyces sp. HK10 TaxID=3373255 RepID=UPI0037482F01